MRIDVAKSQIAAVALMMRDELGEDERLYLDTLEGETDLFEIAATIIGEIEEDEGDVAKLKAQMDDRAARKSRLEHRNEVRRKALCALMEAAKVDKLPLPEATLSVRRVPPKPIVTDEAAVPDEYWKITRRPDLTAIKAGVESGAVIPGVSRDNGGTSLTIRRK